jgi:hypothetical protein
MDQTTNPTTGAGANAGAGSGSPSEAGVTEEKTTVMLGNILVAGGMIAMLVATIANRDTSSGVVAAAMIAAMIGLVFRFPTLLQDGTVTEDNKPAVSTMRVVVLIVVATFVLLTVRAGWSAKGLDMLKIDQSWAWVLGVVLGGKAVQSFGEGQGSAGKPDSKPKA